MMKPAFVTFPLPNTIEFNNPYTQESVTSPKKREHVLSEAFPIGNTFLWSFALMRRMDAL